MGKLPNSPADATRLQERTHTEAGHDDAEKERKSESYGTVNDSGLRIEIAQRTAEEYDGEEQEDAANRLVPYNARWADDFRNYLLREFLSVTKLHAARCFDCVRKLHYMLMLASGKR